MKPVTRACGALSLLCLAAALSAPALGAALTDTKSFDVTVNLTPVCSLSTPGTLTLNYTDNQSGPATGFSTFTATCTSGVAYDLSLSSTTVSAAGLSATLKIQDVDASNADVTDTVTASSSSPRNYRVLGTIAGGQTGTCAASDSVSTSVNTCATVTTSRTLTLTY